MNEYNSFEVSRWQEGKSREKGTNEMSYEKLRISAHFPYQFTDYTDAIIFQEI